MFDPPRLADVKARLSDIPNIDQMSLTLIANRMMFGINGVVVGIDPGASDDQIDAAIRAHLNIQATTPPQRKKLIMSITGAAPAALSIKEMIEQSRVTVQAAHEKLKANAGRVADAANALNGLGDDLGKEADDLLSMVGQYKNDLGGA